MRVVWAAFASFLLAGGLSAQIAQLEIVVGTSQVRNVPFPVTVTARDAGGAVVDDSSTLITFTGTLPAFEPPQFTPPSATLVNGSVTVSAVSTQFGTIQFRVSAASIISTSPFIGVESDSPHLEMDPISTTQVRNVPFDVTVRLIDRFGNPVDDDTKTVEFTGGSVAQFDPDGTGTWVCCPSPKTMTDGVVTMRVRFITAGSGLTFAAGASVGPEESDTVFSPPIEVSPGTLGGFTIDPIAQQQAGGYFSVFVRALTTTGDPFPEFNGTVDFTVDDGNIFVDGTGAATSFRPFVNGVMEEVIWVTKSGTRTVTATLTGGTVSATSNPFDVVASWQRIEVTQPGPQTTNVPFEVVVTAVDDFGNIDTTGLDGTSVIIGTAYGQIALSNDGPFGWNVTTPATFVDGVLRQTVVLDTPGVEQLEVQLPGGSAYDYTDDFQVFSPVDHFEIAPVGAVSVGVPFDLVMTAKDASNTTITPFTGRVTLSSTGGFSPSISANFVNGTLTQPVTFLSTGSHTITVTLEGGTASGTTDTFLASPGPVHHFVFDPIGPQAAGVPFQVRIEARDLGNNLTSYTGTAALRTESGAPVSPAATSAFAAGVLTQTVTLNQAGSMRVIAEDGAASGMSDAFVVSAETTLDHFTIVPIAGSRTAGVAFPISITARDRFGNALVSFSGTASLATNGGTITPTVTPAFTAGVATVDVTLTLAGARTISATSGSAAGASNTFTLDPGPAAQFAIGTAASPVAGVPFALTMQARDAYGNAVPNFTSSVSLGVDAGTVSPSTSNAFVAGMLTQDVTVTGAGARTISATAGAATGSAVIAIAHGPLQHFTFAAVGAQAAATPFDVVITARDVFGNVATSFTGTAALAADGGSMLPAATSAFAGGVRTETVTLTLTGLRTITATSGAAAGTSNAFLVGGGPVDRFQFSAVFGGEAGAAFPVTIEALDVHGNRSSFSGPASLSVDAGTISPATVPFTDGILFAHPVALTMAGSRTLTVTSGAASGVSNTFTITAAPYHTITISPIADQIAGVPFTIDIQSRDIYGNLATGLTHLNLRARIAVDGGSVTPTISQPFAAGTRSETVTLTLAGMRTITVSREGGSESATSNSFQLLTGPPSAAASSVTASKSTALADGVDSIVITAVVRDAGGNALAGKNVSLNGGAVQVTDAGGTATFTLKSAVVATISCVVALPDDGITITQSPVVSFEGGTPASLRLQVPPNVVAGVPFDVAVDVLDAIGNVVTTFQGPHAVSFAGGTGRAAEGSGVLEFSSGTARAPVTFFKSEGTALRATLGDLIGSAPIFVQTGPLARFEFRNLPTQVFGGLRFGSGILIAFDAFDNVLLGFDAAAHPVTLDPSASLAFLDGRPAVLNRSGDFISGAADLSQLVWKGITGSFALEASSGAIRNSSAPIAFSVPALRLMAPTVVCENWGSDVVLQVVGQGFAPGLTIRLDDQPLATTLVSVSQLRATLPWSAIAAGAAAKRISVTAPGGEVIRFLDGSESGGFARVPPLTVTASNDGPVCPGGRVTISGASNYPNAGLLFSGPGISVGRGQRFGTAQPLTSATYTVAASMQLCHTVTATTDVVVHPSPKGRPIIAEGYATIGIEQRAVVGSLPGDTYEWQVSGGRIVSGQGTPELTWVLEQSPAVLSVDITTAGGMCAGRSSKVVRAVVEPCPSSPVAIDTQSPAPGSVNPRRVQFRWTAASDLLSERGYYVIITSEQTSYRVYHRATEPSLVVELPAHATPVTYTWYVQASGRCRIGAVSAPQTFIVTHDGQPPPCEAPALVSPRHDGEAGSDEVTFEWNAQPRDSILWLRRGESGEWVDVYRGTDARVTIPVGFDPVYYWKVQSSGEGCKMSEERRLLRPRCRKPILLGADRFDPEKRTQDVTLRWTPVPGAIGYLVKIERGPGNWIPWRFYSTFTSGNGLVQSTEARVVFDLYGYVTWSVEALLPECSNLVSESAYLYGFSQTCPTSMQLIEPADGLSVSETGSIYFAWSNGSPARKSQLLISRSGGPWLIAASPVPASDGGLWLPLAPGSYRWKIRTDAIGPDRWNCTEESEERRLDVVSCHASDFGKAIDAAAVVIAPAAGAVVTSHLGPTFEWAKGLPGTCTTEACGPETTLHVWSDDGTVAKITIPRETRFEFMQGETRKQLVRLERGHYTWSVEYRYGQCVVRTPPVRFEFQGPLCSQSPLLKGPSYVKEDNSFTLTWTEQSLIGEYEVRETVHTGIRRIVRPTTFHKGTSITLSRPDSVVEEGSSETWDYGYEVRPVDCSREWSSMHAVIIGHVDGLTAFYENYLRDPAINAYDWFTGLFLRDGSPATNANATYKLTSSEPWLTIDPATGPLQPTTITFTADPIGRMPGRNRSMLTLEVTGKEPELIPYDFVIDAPRSAAVSIEDEPPASKTLIIPAVARAKGVSAEFFSDVRIGNRGPQAANYRVTFVPTESDRTAGKSSDIVIPAGGTVALDDIAGVHRITPDNLLGYVEVRALAGLEDEEPSLIVSSRTFAESGDGRRRGGSIGSMSANDFAGAGETLLLVPIRHGAQYRTNVGVVAAHGSTAKATMVVMDAAGMVLAETPIELGAGRHQQIANTVSLDEGRIELRVHEGYLAAYAAVNENRTNDISFIPAVRMTTLTPRTSWFVTGIADLAAWRSDLTLHNAGEAVTVTLDYYAGAAGTALTRTVEIAAGETKTLPDILRTLFGVSGSAGALHIRTEAPSRLIISASTDHHSADGRYGQHIPAVTDEQTRGAGEPALELPQAGQSHEVRSNLGITEVSGKGVRVAIDVIGPDLETKTKIVDFAPHEFRQFNSILAEMIGPHAYNHSIAVRVLEGEGRITAYLCLIDQKTSDPTYFPAQ